MHAHHTRFRPLATALLALLLAACGSSGDSGRGGGGLIDGGGSSTAVCTQPPQLSISGPPSGSPGVAVTDIAVTVTCGASGIRAAEGVSVRLTPTNGTVGVEEQGVIRPDLTTGVTDEFGRIYLAFTPATEADADITGRITATIDDARLLSICRGHAQSRCTGSLALTIQRDEFRFTAPAFGTTATIGASNAQPLQLIWRNASGGRILNPDGGAPCVDLEARFTGGGTAAFGIVIGGDLVPRAQRRVIRLNNAGNFAVPVSVLSDRSGLVEIEAYENRNCGAAATGGLLAGTGVQFIDELCETANEGQDCVDLQMPLALTVVPDATPQAGVDLQMEVRNSAFEPINGAQVLFRILTPAQLGDSNERIFPGGGTTNANGQARSRYFAPNITTTTRVDIEACVRGAGAGDQTGQVCRRRQLTLRPPPTATPVP